MNPKAVDSAFTMGRLQKAHEFAEAAAVLFDEATRNSDHGDVYVTLAIHSGIASSDVICVTKLGEYSAGDSHRAAVALLKKNRPGCRHTAQQITQHENKICLWSSGCECGRS